MARRPVKPTPAHSMGTLLVIGLFSLVTLGGLVWLALVYSHEALLAVLLPILPVLFSFFTEQCRATLAELREDDEDENPGEELSQDPR